MVTYLRRYWTRLSGRVKAYWQRGEGRQLPSPSAAPGSARLGASDTIGSVNRPQRGGLFSRPSSRDGIRKRSRLPKGDTAKTIIDYVDLLQQLVYHMDDFEVTENTRNALQNTLKHFLVDIELPTDNAVQRKLEEALDEVVFRISEFDALVSNASTVHLPQYLKVQLARFRGTQRAFQHLSQRTRECDSRSIDIKLPGCSTTTNAQRHLVKNIRELCKHCIPRALHDDIILNQERNVLGIPITDTETLLRRENLVGPPARPRLLARNKLRKFADLDEEIRIGFPEVEEGLRNARAGYSNCLARELEDKELAGRDEKEEFWEVFNQRRELRLKRLEDLKEREANYLEWEAGIMEEGCEPFPDRLMPLSPLDLDLPVFDSHPYDDEKSSITAFDAITADETRRNKFTTRMWVEWLRDATGNSGLDEAASEPSMSAWSAASIGIGDSRSFQREYGPSMAQKEKIREWERKRETVRQEAEQIRLERLASKQPHYTCAA